MSNFNFDTTSERVAEAFSNEIRCKMIIVTGATCGGLGADNAHVLCSIRPKLVIIITGRSHEKLDDTVSKIKEEIPDAKLRTLLLDLASSKSIHKAAEEVNTYSGNIDVLINNAGVMACPYGKTEDGFETQFGTNHLDLFLFTTLILKKILASPHPRIVNVSSVGQAHAPIIFEDPGFSNGA